VSPTGKRALGRRVGQGAAIYGLLSAATLILLIPATAVAAGSVARSAAVLTPFGYAPAACVHGVPT
jgi:hypothetical protein